MDLAAPVLHIGRVQAALARYHGLVAADPTTRLLFAPLTVQKAMLPSKIEGTQVTMGEVLEADVDGDALNVPAEKRADIEEVRNHRLALGFAADAISDRPLSEHLLRETHALLMRGVRGQDKEPRSYRTDQIWIGAPGCAIDEPSFVPIAPAHVAAGMEAWARYLNDETQPDPIVQLAIAHVELLALHPFRDGNGRLGRMLIPLFLCERGLLGSPCSARCSSWPDPRSRDPRHSASSRCCATRSSSHTARPSRGRRRGVYVFTERIEIVEGVR